MARFPLVHERLSPDAFADVQRRDDRWTWGMALVLATAVHVGVLLAASPGRDDRIGAGGIDLEAVSVEVSIISAGALESRSADRDKASGVAGRVDLRDGATDPPAPVREAPTAQPEAATHTDAKERESVRDPELPSPEPVKSAAAANPTDPAPAATAGGPAALAIADVLPVPASGAAAASIGEMQVYSASVVEILAKSRPRAEPGMETGTVVVAFEIAATGAPVNVRVSKSSGRPRIDRMVIEAIETARFPSPPEKATPAQRTYALPYVFRR